MFRYNNIWWVVECYIGQVIEPTFRDKVTRDLPFFFQNKDDVEQRDTGAFHPDNRRWKYKQTIFFFKYYNKKLQGQ
jgi:hypothetical protein